jgi:hypothetical protein
VVMEASVRSLVFDLVPLKWTAKMSGVSQHEGLVACSYWWPSSNGEDRDLIL